MKIGEEKVKQSKRSILVIADSGELTQKDKKRYILFFKKQVWDLVLKVEYLTLTCVPQFVGHCPAVQKVYWFDS